MQAEGTHAAGIKSVPSVTARAQPEILLSGRPIARRTPDARARTALVFLFASLRTEFWVDCDAGARGAARHGAHA